MSDVYITNASLNIISKSLKDKLKNTTREEILINISNDFDKNFLTSQNLNELFNTKELREIFITKSILKNLNILLDSIAENKNIITKHIDMQNKKYAFKIKQPSYHSNKACEWMHKKFNNIEIPLECIKNDDLKNKAKKWLNTNKENLKRNFAHYNNIFKNEFNCIEGLKEIYINNSGTTLIKDIDFNQAIKSKYMQLRFFFDSEFAEKIINFKYADNYKINKILKKEQNKKEKQSIIDFHTIKAEVKNLIIGKYKIEYNKNLSFKKNILDLIGFKACNSCINNIAYNL